MTHSLYLSQKSLAAKEFKPGRTFADIVNRNFHENVRKILWQGQRPQDTYTLIDHLNTLPIPYLSFYVISTNPVNLNRVIDVLKDYPCLIYKLENHHFDLSPPYESFGVDRIANLQALVADEPALIIDQSHQNPHVNKAFQTLLVDGGTITTVTSVKAITNNHPENATTLTIEARSITPGIQGEIYSIQHQAPILGPTIDYKRLQERLENSQAPLPVVHHNTADQIYAAILKRYLLFIVEEIDAWLESCNDNDEEEEHKKPCVHFTGGQGDFMKTVLENADSLIQLTQHTRDRIRNILERVSLKRENKPILHRGVVSLLRNRQEDLALKEDAAMEKLRQSTLGLRVAVRFGNKFRSDNWYRGTVVQVRRCNRDILQDKFFIAYDDKDDQEMYLNELCDALEAYVIRGENANSRLNPGKTKQAQEVVSLLREKYPNLPPSEYEPASKKRSREARDSPSHKRIHHKLSVQQHNSSVPESVPHIAADAPGEDGSLSANNAPKVVDNEIGEHDRNNPAKMKKYLKAYFASRSLNKIADHIRDYLIGKRVAKVFFNSDNREEVFFGTIDRIDMVEVESEMSELFHVTYDDEDHETMADDDLLDCLELYEDEKAHDPKYIAVVPNYE